MRSGTRKRPVLAAALAVLGVLVAVAVAACGGSSAQKDAGGNVRLTVWNDQYVGDAVPAYDAIDREFEKANPTIKIHEVAVPQEQAPDKLRAAIAARQGADLVSLYPGTYAATFRSGLADLRKFLNPSQRDQILLLDASVAPDGGLYSIGTTAYGYVWMYNKKLFARAGLDPANPPRTWDDFLNACTALKGANIAPVAAGWRDGVMLEWFMYVFGDQLLTPSERQAWFHGKLPVDNPKFARVIDNVKAMRDRGCFQDGGNARDVNQTVGEFANGHAAMVLFWISASGETGSPSQKATKVLGARNVGSFLPPLVPGSAFDHVIMDTGPGHGMGITKFSQHPREAWKYLSFLLAKGPQEELLQRGGFLPVNRTTNPASNPDPVVRDVIRNLKIPGNYTIYMGFTPPVLDTLHAQTMPLLAGKVSTRSVLAQMQQKQTQVMAGLAK